MKSKKVIVDGVKIEQNPLTGDWFIIAKSRKTGEDRTIFGRLNEMKRCAKFAAKHKTIMF
ncbi:MAG: hypothetical protein JETCAE03_35090 [Ignavibacteriaceae bacterium]|nr:MAG: hypothetical protein JETCAE03_35090 [Ignavibacteriaceae bacterium]